MSGPSAPSGGFSLFPNTSVRPPSRTQSRNQRPRATTPSSQMQEPQSSVDITPPRARRTGSVSEGRQGHNGAVGRSGSALDYQSPSSDRRGEVVITAPPPVADIPPRCDTAFSEARTLVRNQSTRSRSSIAKPPIQYAPAGPSTTSESTLRSIFPQYNYEVSLDRQEYYPTQASPTQIPRSAISRPLYSPTEVDASGQPMRSPP